MGYFTLVGGLLSRYLLPLLPWAGPNVSLIGIALLGLTISHGWVAYKVYAKMSDYQEVALRARDGEWKNEIARSNAAHEKLSENAIQEANKLGDPKPADINGLCDHSIECRDKGVK